MNDFQSALSTYNLAKVVTMTAYRRPTYTQQVLEALVRCVGVEEYQVLVHLEPGFPEVRKVILDSPIPGLVLIENADLLGCGDNTFAALHHGFQRSDFVIHLEDDTVPSQDFLRYFEWAREEYAVHQDIFSIAAYAKSHPSPEHFYDVQRLAWFTPWGWGTWRDRWGEIAANWSNSPDTWDVTVNNKVRGDRKQLQPVLARCQNIGAEMGTQCPTPEWHRENQWNDFGAWSISINPSTTYREIP